MVASEMHPFATSGGLAEVVGSLSQALAASGTTSRSCCRATAGPRVASPTSALGRDAAPVGTRRRRAPGDRFRRTPAAGHVPAAGSRRSCDGRVRRGARSCSIATGSMARATATIPTTRCASPSFSRAALEYVRLRGERPSVIHAHDWQAGLVPGVPEDAVLDDPVVGGVPVVFTIHNLAFQGVFPAATLLGDRACRGTSSTSRRWSSGARSAI